MTFSELSIPFVSASEVIAAGIVIPIAGITVVVGRFWLRCSPHSNVGADDYSILGALVYQTQADLECGVR